MKGRDMRIKRAPLSAWRTILLIILLVYVSDLIVMSLFSLLPDLHAPYVIIPLLLLCILFPFFYFIVFQPMKELFDAKNESEESLQIQKDFTEQLLGNTSAAIFVINRDHRVIYWNHACEELSGIRSEDIVGTSDHWKAFYKTPRKVLSDHIIDGSHEKLRDHIQQYSPSALIPGGVRVEGWFDSLQEGHRYLIIEGSPVYAKTGKLVSSIETIQDITTHKETEEAFTFISQNLGVSTGQEFFRLLVINLAKALNAAYAFVGVMDREDPMTVNTIAVSAHGGSADNFSYYLEGTPCSNVVGKALCVYPNKVQEQFPEDTMLVEMSIESYAGTPLFDSQLNPIGLLVVVDTKPLVNADLTVSILNLFAVRAAGELERSRRDQELRARTAQLSSLMNNLQSGIIFESMDREVIFTNQTFCDIFGLRKPPSALRGKDYRIEAQSNKHLFSDANGFLSGMEKAVQNGDIVIGEMLELIDGRILERDYIPVRSEEEGIGHLWQYRDVTGRRQLELQLLHAQKMEAVGQLAGGIAHDFNNVLTAIVGYASLLQLKLEENHPLRIYADNIADSVDKASSLTKSLLTFSRKQMISPHPLRINEVIQRVEKWLARLIGEDIVLRTELTEEDTTVVADEGQLEQVLMNLVNNARDAMARGGKLTISTQIVIIDHEEAGRHPDWEAGTYVAVTVTDTGIGIDKDSIEKVLEPFYTTKENGKGTGLGLPVVYGIISQHRGFLDVRSEKGSYTSFTFYLPLSDEVVIEQPMFTQHPEKATHETILIAEDDENVREINKEVLEQFGYTVIEAVDGEDAVRKYEANKDRIDLLLLDMIMPRKNGKEVFDEIRMTDPDVKALFLSGYASNFLDERGILPEGTEYLQKPLIPVNLLSKVREALEGGYKKDISTS